MFILDKPIGIRMTKEDTIKLQELATKKRVSLSTYCRTILAKHINYEKNTF